MARSPKKIASKSRGGTKARGRPAAKKAAASKKRASKAASRKTTQARKAPASKSRTGSKARGRSAAKSASRSTKTASKRASTSRNQSPAKSPPKRMGAGQKTRRTANANLGAPLANPATEAMAFGTGIAAGAMQASGEIIDATADMANSAARTVMAVTTGVVPEDSPEGRMGRARKGGRGGRKSS